MSEAEDNGLTVFDIDDTLFHTTAVIKVLKDGKVIKTLTSAEYNEYKLKSGEKYDFGEFKSSKKFHDESKPIRKMLAKAKAMLKNIANKPNSKIIVVTARGDFDDKKLFLQTFRKHGLDIDQIRVERAGKISDVSGTAAKKSIIIRNYLNTGKFSRVRLFDDNLENLKVFLKLQKSFPDITFEAYFAKLDGTVKTVKT